jgi:hypothetical protein
LVDFLRAGVDLGRRTPIMILTAAKLVPIADPVPGAATARRFGRHWSAGLQALLITRPPWRSTISCPGAASTAAANAACGERAATAEHLDQIAVVVEVDRMPQFLYRLRPHGRPLAGEGGSAR